MFEPWICVWQTVQFWNRGFERSCVKTPPDGSRESPISLWHWMQSWKTVPRTSIRLFTEPCGLWHVTQPSSDLLIARCSKTNGPCLSEWHFAQRADMPSAERRASAVFRSPCPEWQSRHEIAPSSTLWWNGLRKSDSTSLWHLKQSPGASSISRYGLVVS